MNHILEHDFSHVILNALQGKSNILRAAIQIYITVIALDGAKVL